MDHYLDEFSLRKKRLHYLMDAVVIVFCAWYSILDIKYNGTASYMQIGLIGFSFAHMFAMILAGLFGYVHSMIFIVLIFLYAVTTDITRSYMVFLFLLVTGLAYYFARHHWLKSIWKTLLATVISALVLGDGWYLLTCTLTEIGFSQVTLLGLVTLFVMMLPQCFIAYFGLYLFYRLAPDRVKDFFYVGFFYTGRYAKYKEEGGEKTSILGKRILIGLVIDLVIIMFTAILLAALLFGAVVPKSQEEPGERASIGKNEQFEEAAEFTKDGFIGGASQLAFYDKSFAQTGEIVPGASVSRTDSYYAFCMELGMMLSVIVIPVIVLTYYAVNTVAVNPMRKIASFMSSYAGASDEGKEKLLQEMPEIEPKVRDEIWDIYHSLLIMLGNMNRYITKIKEDQQIEAELEVAKQASDAKTAFLSNMSHEIRTPINAVLGMDEVIIRETREENTLSYARDIQSAGRTLLALINDILDFSKIESGKMEIIPTEYDVRDMVEELVNMIGFRARGKGLNLEAKVSPRLPQHLYGDELRIRQIITNILTNAVKYTEKGYVTLALDYEKLDNKHILLKVSVKDTGIGIKSEDLEKLFAPFERIDEKRNLTVEGTGLGMSIVRSLLFQMGSSLDVKSTYGRGSNFSFELVQEVLEWKEIGDVDIMSSELKPQKKYHESFRAPNAKVLVVDDTTTNHMVMKGLLKNTRVKIDTADSGSEALYLMKTHHYHMLFIDHRMPGMDGVEVLEHLREMPDNPNYDTPAIALTANVVSGAKEMYLEHGFWDYLSKPVDGARLEEMMITYLPPELVEFPMGDDFEEQEDTAVHGGDADAGEEDMSDLQKLQGVNLSEALKNCGDAETLRGIVKEFRTVIREKADKIEKLFEERDYENYTIEVHALKSSARLIGAMDLSAQAAHLEACGNDKNEAEISEKTSPLLSLYRSYIDNLAAISDDDEEDDASKPFLDSEGFLSALDDLKELLLVYDYDNADQIMEQLKNYQIPDEYREKYDRIKTLMAEVDRDHLLEIL